MPNPLNILQLNPVRGLSSGGPRQAYQLSVELVKRGHKVIYACRQGREAIPEYPGLNIIYLPLRNELDFFSIQQIGRIIRDEKINVIHVHKGLAHSLAYLPARWHKVPGFFVNRGVTFPLNVFNRHKYNFKGISRIIAVSEMVKKVLLESGHIPGSKIVVVPGGTDMEFFDWQIDPTPIRQEFNLGNTQVIGMIGNIREWKGHHYLLKAVREISPHFPKLKLLLVGDADQEELVRELKLECQEMGLSGRVVFTGFRQDVPNLLAAMDLTVIASYAGEGLTGAVRESLAMKKPVVATDVGGMREIIQDGINGKLVPSKNPAALAAAITELLDNDKLRLQMGEAGYRLILEKFSCQKRIEQIEQLYFDAVQLTIDN